MYARSNYSDKLAKLKSGIGNKDELNAAKKDYDDKYKRLDDFKKGTFVPVVIPVANKPNPFKNKSFKNTTAEREKAYLDEKARLEYEELQKKYAMDPKLDLDDPNVNNILKVNKSKNQVSELPIFEQKYYTHNNLQRPTLRKPPIFQSSINTSKKSKYNKYTNRLNHNIQMPPPHKILPHKNSNTKYKFPRKTGSRLQPPRNTLKLFAGPLGPVITPTISVNTPVNTFTSSSNTFAEPANTLSPLNVESITQSLQDKLAARQQRNSQFAESLERKLTPEQIHLAEKLKIARDELRAFKGKNRREYLPKEEALLVASINLQLSLDK